MSLTTITVSGVTYDVYGSVNELVAYAAASILPSGVTFTTDFTRQQQLIVTGTRLFERTSWRGTKTSSSQALQWPRDGINDRDGNSIDGTTPDDIFNGFFELAILLDNDPDNQILTSEQNAGNGNKKKERELNRVEGAVTQETETEYFIPLVGTRTGAHRLPLAVYEFVKPWLASSQVVTGISSGTDETSSFDEDEEAFNFVEPGVP